MDLLSDGHGQGRLQASSGSPTGIDVDRQQARLAVLEGLDRAGLAFGFTAKAFEVADPVTA
jgi:hypothetical protein